MLRVSRGMYMTEMTFLVRIDLTLTFNLLFSSRMHKNSVKKKMLSADSLTLDWSVPLEDYVKWLLNELSR